MCDDEYECEHGRTEGCPTCILIDKINSLIRELQRTICKLTEHVWFREDILTLEGRKDIIMWECQRCMDIKYEYEDGSPVEHGEIVFRLLYKKSKAYEAIPKLPWRKY